MVSKTPIPQQNMDCILEDLPRTMSELSLKYEEIKNLKESLIEKETRIDSLKEVVSSKEVYISEIQEAKKQAEINIPKQEIDQLEKNHSLEQNMFYGTKYQWILPNLENI